MKVYLYTKTLPRQFCRRKFRSVKSPHLKHTCIIDIFGSNAAQEKELCAASLTVFVVFPTVVGLSV